MYFATKSIYMLIGLRNDEKYIDTSIERRLFWFVEFPRTFFVIVKVFLLGNFQIPNNNCHVSDTFCDTFYYLNSLLLS